MRIEVCHLFERPECLPVVANWIHTEWWNRRSGRPLIETESRLRRAKDADHIPLVLLATANGAPAGTVSLVESDAETRSHLTPWLAELFVKPRYRGHGVGSALVDRLILDARRLKVPRMYLGTDIPGFYTRFGATILERVKGPFVTMWLPTGH